MGLRRWMLGAAVVAAAVHVVAARPATTPTHDGLITLHLAATALPAWDAAVADPDWAPATTWQSLVEPGTPSNPVTIARHSAKRDLHPPGYPLLVSVWQPVAGRSMRMLLLVNAVIAGALAAVGVGLASRLGATSWLAGLAGVAGAASPGMLATGLLLRPYMLVALWSTALLWWLAMADDQGDGIVATPATSGRWLAGAGLAAGLMATSYVGVFVLAGVAAGRLVSRSPWRRRLADGVALAVGALSVVVLLPGVLDQVALQRALQARGLFTATVIRLKNVVRAFASPVTVEPAGEIAVVVLLAVGAALAVTMVRRRRAVIPVALALVVMVAGYVGFYMAARWPRFAMAPKYIAFALPGMVVLMVLAARSRAERAAATVIVAMVLVAGIWSARTVLEPPPDEHVRTVEAVVATNWGRGVGLRHVWHVPARTPTLIGDADRVLENLDTAVGCRLLVLESDQGRRRPDPDDLVRQQLAQAGWGLVELTPPAIRSKAYLATRDGC